jgi:hypothetical protein
MTLHPLASKFPFLVSFNSTVLVHGEHVLGWSNCHFPSHW